MLKCLTGRVRSCKWMLMAFVMMFMSNMGTWAQSSPYTGVAVGSIVSGNDYYLYNVESGLWLQNNDRKANDWSTRGQLGMRGLDFQLNAVEGGYKINAKFGKASISRDNYYLDNNDDHVWVFAAKDGSVSNAVTIKSDTKYLAADSYTAGNPYNNMYKVGEPNTAQWYLNNPENSTNGTWQIVTKEERLAKMAAATNQSPMDASWLIKSPDFANHDSRYNSWTKTTDDWSRSGDADGDWGRGSMIVESWNKGSNAEISQTISDIPNGIYELTFQGFYRDGAVGDIGGKYDEKTEEIRAKYYANNVEADFRSIIYPDHTTALTEPNRWPQQTGSYYVPNSMEDCSRCMNLENVYHNTPIRVLVTDGTLKIGVKKTGSVSDDWVIIDNFKLTYYGYDKWNGTDDAILPSIKYGGSYSAYTWTTQSSEDFGDWNTSNSHYNQIVGTPGESNGKKWYETDYDMPISSGIQWQHNNSVLPSNWATGDKYGDVYVRRYFVVNNTLPSTVYMPAPHDDSPCEYYINGTLVWSRTGNEPSVNGWYEDEVVRLTNEQKALIHTDGTVNVFAFHVHQNWGGRYADGGLYGNAGTDGSPSKKFTDDTNRSRLEGVFNQFSVSDFTSLYGISQETANKAKDACNYRQDASYYFDQLFPAALATRISTAESIKDSYSMSTAGTTALNSAISTATTAKDAGDKGGYVTGLTALNSAIDAAVIDVRQQLAERSPQPTIFTMISNSVVGTDDNNYATEVTEHADGFYVYNVGTGRWFCGGDDWGAHAAVGFPGIKITTPKNDYESGHYNSVVTWLFNGNWGVNGMLNHGGYCDTGGNGWKFWQQDAEHGIYTWSRNGDNTGDNTGLGCGTQGLVGFAPSTYARVNTDRTGADDPYNQWIFVTEAQRDAMAEAAMATASELNPVDLTYKIKMPGFNQRERKEGTNQETEELDWTCNHANYKYSNGRLLLMGRNDNHADFVCDVYGEEWKDAFSWTQTITGLTPGIYRVKVQGYNKNGDAANKAYLVANGQTTTLREHNSESRLPWSARLPENTFENPEYFQMELYWNAVLCTVGSNGELTLGVESPSITGGHVVVFDNFRLEFVGMNTKNVTLNEGYATFSSVDAYRIDSEDVNAYKVTEKSATEVNLVELTDGIPANTGVVLYGEGKNTVQLTAVSSSASDVSGNLMKPNVTDYELPSSVVINDITYNNYTLGKHNNEVKFLRSSGSGTLAAGKAYLQLEATAAARVSILFFDEEGEQITPISEKRIMKSEESANAPVYNLAGQRMDSSLAKKGLYVVNGKKLVVR